MDEKRARQLTALKAAMAQPLFDEAIDELRRALADAIADTFDPVKADAMRAERAALERLRGQLQSKLNELTMESPRVN